LWGAFAGLAGGIGVALLYRALAVGVMSVVAPVTAVCAVAVPVIVAVAALGERPTRQASVGIAIAIAAIVLVSQSSAPDAHQSRGSRRGLGLALAAGVAIGVFFLALAQASAEAGLWPLLFARLSSVTCFVIAVLGTRRTLQMPAGVLRIAAAGGILDMLANLLYLLAARRGSLTLAVTLSSLYPASTVLLARLVLHERLSLPQWVGVALTLAAIVMIVLE